MLLSMTGFGKAVAEVSNRKITAEIKSLNSKQLDLTVRIPSVYREFELELRNNIARELQRGKADLSVSVETINGATASAALDLAALQAYKQQIEEASNALGIPEPTDWYQVLMRFPDVMQSATEVELSDEEIEALHRAVDEAARALTEYRAVEGAKLEEFFGVRIERIRNLLGQIAPYEAERIIKVRQKLADGLAKLPAVEIDKGRLEQEMIFYIEKLDVNEEKQRLSQHLDYFLETMHNPQPGQGKKLGFISQEMGREINTLGSKSNHAEMQRIVVMMKDELEQIKEQVLNVM